MHLRSGEVWGPFDPSLTSPPKDTWLPDLCKFGGAAIDKSPRNYEMPSVRKTASFQQPGWFAFAHSVERVPRFLDRVAGIRSAPFCIRANSSAHLRRALALRQYSRLCTIDLVFLYSASVLNSSQPIGGGRRVGPRNSVCTGTIQKRYSTVRNSTESMRNAPE